MASTEYWNKFATLGKSQLAQQLEKRKRERKRQNWKTTKDKSIGWKISHNWWLEKNIALFRTALNKLRKLQDMKT